MGIKRDKKRFRNLQEILQLVPEHWQVRYLMQKQKIKKTIKTNGGHDTEKKESIRPIPILCSLWKVSVKCLCYWVKTLKICVSEIQLHRNYEAISLHQRQSPTNLNNEVTSPPLFALSQCLLAQSSVSATHHQLISSLLQPLKHSIGPFLHFLGLH